MEPTGLSPKRALLGVEACGWATFPSVETLPPSRKDFITFQNTRAGSFLQAATSEAGGDLWLAARFPLFWEV